MEDIKNHDYTLDELKELYKKNNKKWQDEYLSTHPIYIKKMRSIIKQEMLVLI